MLFKRNSLLALVSMMIVGSQALAIGGGATPVEQCGQHLSTRVRGLKIVSVHQDIDVRVRGTYQNCEIPQRGSKFVKYRLGFEFTSENLDLKNHGIQIEKIVIDKTGRAIKERASIQSRDVESDKASIWLSSYDDVTDLVLRPWMPNPTQSATLTFYSGTEKLAEIQAH